MDAVARTIGLRLLVRRHANRPTEVWTLVALDALGSLVCFLGAFAPFTHHHFVGFGIIFGFVFAALAAGVWVFGSRISRIGLFVASVAGVASISTIVTAARTNEGAVLITFPFIWTVIYAASFFSRRELHGLLLLVAVGSLAGLAVDRPSRWQAVWVLLNLTTVTAGLVVGRASERLRREADTDHLTGALNRRGLHKASIVTRSVAERLGAQLVVALIDLDDFKGVNDAWGHAAGDRVLVEATAAWARELRVGDLLARLGGDEFLVLLPGIATEQIEPLLERLHGAHPIRWTTGWATWGPDEDLEACMRRADAELYTRKLERRIREASEDHSV